MAKRNNNVLVMILLPLACLSCSRGTMYSETFAMNGNNWDLENVLSFDAAVDDTVNSYNVLFSIRSGSSYPYRNLYLFVNTMSPDGRMISDTLKYYLMDEKGKRFGSGFGDIRELNLPYKSNVYFPVKGSYKFIVRHGMRDPRLGGVYDIGLRIEKVSK